MAQLPGFGSRAGAGVQDARTLQGQQDNNELQLSMEQGCLLRGQPPST